MKKFAIIISIILVVIVAIMGVDFTIEYVKPLENEVTEAQVTEPVVVDDSTYIAITAVGDCTLGTDTNYGGITSFESEMINRNYNYSHFLSLVKPFFEVDDLTIVNFEGTLSNRGERQTKEYTFRANPEYAKILTTSSVEAVNLANNHTYDFGESAFLDTKKTMDENGIIWFEGKNYAITEVKGIKVGLIGTNGLTSAGRNQFPKIIEKVKLEGAQLIIASFHWGEERVYTPTETQIALAHSAIDNGADLVLGHHPHVLQGIEKYKGKYIVYSLGNFCFGGHKNPPDKDTMIFRQIFRFVDGQIMSDYDNAQIVPCSISSVADRNNYQPMPLVGDEFGRVKSKILELSAGFSGIDSVQILENMML